MLQRLFQRASILCSPQFLLAGSLAITSVSITPVHATPPPDADGQYAAYFQSLKNLRTGEPCCSVADCREVPARFEDDGHWHAYISRRTFGGQSGAPDDYVLVPNVAMAAPQPGAVRPPNAVACWGRNGSGRVILCFDPPPSTEPKTSYYQPAPSYRPVELRLTP